MAIVRSVKPRPGIRLHVVRWLPDSDRARRAGVPVTTPARTLLDLAGIVGERALARAVHEAEVQGVVSNAELRERLRDVSGRREKGVLQALVEEGPVGTRSDLEDATFALLRRHDLPRPHTNNGLPGLPAWVEVDSISPPPNVVVEVDGDRFDSTCFDVDWMRSSRRSWRPRATASSG